MYVGTETVCKKIADIYAKHGSKEDLAKLNAVPKALKAAPMKVLRDFQRRQFGTPPWFHYNRTLHRVEYDNSYIDKLTRLEQEHLHAVMNREDCSEHEVEIQNEAVDFEVNMPLIVFEVNRQQPRSLRKIPTPIKWLISPLPEMINQIRKKYSLGYSE